MTDTLGYIVREVGGRHYLMRIDRQADGEASGLTVAAFWREDFAAAFNDWLCAVLKVAAKAEGRAVDNGATGV